MVKIMYCIVLIFVFQFSYGQAYVPDWKYFDTTFLSKPIDYIDFESARFTESSIYQFDSVVCYNPLEKDTTDLFYRLEFDFRFSNSLEYKVKCYEKKRCDEINCRKSIATFFNNYSLHKSKDSVFVDPISMIYYNDGDKTRKLRYTGKSFFDTKENNRHTWLSKSAYQKIKNKNLLVKIRRDVFDITFNAFNFRNDNQVDSFRMGMYPEVFNSAHMIELGSQQIIFNQPIKNFAGLPNYEGCPKNGSLGIYNFKETIPFSFGKPEKPFKLHPFITQKDALKYRGSSPEEALRLYQFGYGDVLVNTVCDDFDVSEENRTYNLDLKDETYIDVKKVLKFKCDGVNFIAFNYDLHYSYYNTKNNFVRKNNTQVLRYDFEDKTWKVTKSYNYTMDHIIHILSRLKYDVLFKFVGNFSKGPDSSWTQLEKDVYEFCGKRNFYVQRLIILINYWRETEQQDKLDALFGKDMMIQDLLFEILFSPKEYQENNDYSGGWDE